ncbi:MAG: iron-containing alcohol dehydrogenase [Pseudomonadales bacterium]
MTSAGTEPRFAASFRAAGYAWRLFCGPGVLDKDLRGAVARHGARRAFLLCSPSITRTTTLVRRVSAALGDSLAGTFDGIENDSTWSSVHAATEAARVAGADLLIAVGGGSVLVAVRAVAIFLAEQGSPFDLMTQYPADGKPVSPRLEAPKLPIINIPTTPTSAMNRAGTGLKNPELDHRMEYFDPKTRPQAIFLDDEALLGTPFPVYRSTATTVFAGLVASAGTPADNPLVEADVQQAIRLGIPAYLQLRDMPHDPTLRRHLCLAAFLQNRAEDDGRPLLGQGAFGGNYAVSTALHLVDSRIGQGEATSAVHAHAIRLAERVDPTAARLTANALDVPHGSLSTDKTAHAVADRLEAVYRAIGMPVRLRELGITTQQLPRIAAETVKNFNARSTFVSPQARIAQSLRLLESAW